MMDVCNKQASYAAQHFKTAFTEAKKFEDIPGYMVPKIDGK